MFEKFKKYLYLILCSIFGFCIFCIYHVVHLDLVIHLVHVCHSCRRSRSSVRITGAARPPPAASDAHAASYYWRLAARRRGGGLQRRSPCGYHHPHRHPHLSHINKYKYTNKHICISLYINKKKQPHISFSFSLSI